MNERTPEMQEHEERYAVPRMATAIAKARKALQPTAFVDVVRNASIALKGEGSSGINDYRFRKVGEEGLRCCHLASALGLLLEMLRIGNQAQAHAAEGDGQPLEICGAVLNDAEATLASLERAFATWAELVGYVEFAEAA